MITKLNSNIGNLSSLSTSEKASAVAAINEVYGRTNNDVLMYKSSAATHTFNLPNNSRHLVIFTGDGISRYWFGFIYCGSAGAVSLAEISKGSNASVASSANNKVTFNAGETSVCYARSVNIRGGAMTV